jgi:N-methylhydantoinase B
MTRIFDPILVEVVKNELAAIAEEMAIAVCKTGRSAMVRIGDFAAAICDSQGRIIGPGYAAPFQLGNFIELMPFVLKKYGGTFIPGDVVVVNDPYAGMGHMPDTAIVAPVFWREQLVAFNVSYSHHTDVGGRFPGGFSSQCSESFEEGVRLPLVKIYDGGKRNEALLDTILANVRAPDEWIGDLEAKAAGAWRGAQEMGRMLDKYGLDTFNSCCDYLIDYAERETRAAIRAIPDGRYIHEEIFEDDGFGNAAALPMKLTIRVAGDALTADFTGTAPQVKSALNNPISLTKAMVYGALKAIVNPDVPINNGFIRPIQVQVPLGTLLNPRFPAAVGGRGPVVIRLFEVVFRALAKALPEKMPLPGEAGDVLHFTGHTKEGRPFAVMDLIFGGWGGRPHKDGIDGCAPMGFGSYGAVPAEILERDYPLVIDQFGYLPDSGGPGKYRGSLSVVREWRFLQPGHAMVRTCRLNDSDGIAGGQAGGRSLNILNPETDNRELPRQTHMHLEVQPGDRIYHIISGAGGHGDPWERAPEMVLADVKGEKVTPAGAREQYGVIIDPETLSIDWRQTEQLRRSHQAQGQVIAAAAD